MVFVEEQGFQNEFDPLDETARHIVLYRENAEPIATCRILAGQGEGQYILGRVAVIPSCRGMQLGARLVAEAERLVLQSGGTVIQLHAQCRVKVFYEKLGYVAFGEIEEDEGCPHIWMSKTVCTPDTDESN